MKNQKRAFVSFCMWLLPLTFFAYQFILRLWPSLMMQQIMQRIAIDATAFGFLSSVYYWGYASMQIPIALALDRYKTRYILFSCALVCCIGTLLFSFTSNWHYALLSRFLVGAGSAAGFLSTSKVISSWFDKTEYSNMIGFSFTFGMFGAIYAGKPVSMMIDSFGWQSVAFGLALVALIIGILALLLLKNPDSEKTESLQLASLHQVLKSPVIWIIAIANLLMVGALEGFADVWGINYLMIAYNLNKADAAQLISFIFIGMLFGGPVLAYLGKKLGNYIIVCMCGGGIVLAFMTLIYMTHLNWLVLAMLFFAVGIMCCYQVLIFTIGSELVHLESVGITVAFLNCINMLGGSFFHSLIGFAMDFFWTGTMIDAMRYYTIDSYQYALMIIPVCAFIGAFLLFILKVYLGKYSQKIVVLTIAIITMHNSFVIASISENTITASVQNNAAHILIGSLTGIAEVSVNQPLIYLKNMIQQRKNISLDPRILYRGLGIGIFCMAPTTAVQLAVENKLQDILSEADTKTKTIRALIAGAFSSVVSTPTESIVLHQQNNGTPLFQTIRDTTSKKGFSVLYRGLTAKALRDSLFCAGLLSMYPFFEQQLPRYTDSKLITSIGSSILAGVITAVVSHPFDTISILQQANCKETKKLIQTTLQLYQTNSFFGFFKGIIPRGTRIILAIPLMHYAKEFFTDTLIGKDKNRGIK